MGAVDPTLTARMGLSPISSGPLGHGRTTTAVDGSGSGLGREAREARELPQRHALRPPCIDRIVPVGEARSVVADVEHRAA